MALFLENGDAAKDQNHQQEAVGILPSLFLCSNPHVSQYILRTHTQSLTCTHTYPHAHIRTHHARDVQAIETLSKAFEILDIDDSGRILCEDFLDVALHMDEPAKKEDIYHTRLAVSHLLSGVHQQTEQVKEAALGLGAGCRLLDRTLSVAGICVCVCKGWFGGEAFLVFT